MVEMVEMENVQKRDSMYDYKTQEKYRMDQHFIFRNPLMVQSIQKWMNQVIKMRKLRPTRHYQERVREYENKMSRNGKYIELFSKEKEIVLSLHLRDFYFEIVEIGLNRYKRCCKIGILVPMNQFCFANEKTRNMFITVGADAGLKTFYMVENTKNRSNYRIPSFICKIV